MAGHPILSLNNHKESTVVVSGRKYSVQLGYYRIPGITGDVVGIKFTDDSNNMDASKKGQVSGIALGRAIGQQVVQMIKPDLDKITILGFYLLTDELSNRGQRAVLLKSRIYGVQAQAIHEQVKHYLPLLHILQVKGGMAWTMSKVDLTKSQQFSLIEQELGKQLEVLQ